MDRTDPEPIDLRLLDRLVDGELTGPERRALLARLEAEPDRDGWRRRALAFLEAQCWREALADRSPADSDWPEGEAEPDPVLPIRRRRWTPALAGAAAVLSAFAVGWLAGGSARDRPGGAGMQAAVQDAPSPAPGPQGAEPAPCFRPSATGNSATRTRAVTARRSGSRSSPAPASTSTGSAASRRHCPPPTSPAGRTWATASSIAGGSSRSRSTTDEYVSIPVDEVDLQYVGPTTF